MAALVLLASALVIVLALWLIQRRLIYLPDTSVPSLAAVGSGWD